MGVIDYFRIDFDNQNDRRPYLAHLSNTVFRNVTIDIKLWGFEKPKKKKVQEKNYKRKQWPYTGRDIPQTPHLL